MIFSTQSATVAIVLYGLAGLLALTSAVFMVTQPTANVVIVVLLISSFLSYVAARLFDRRNRRSR